MTEMINKFNSGQHIIHTTSRETLKENGATEISERGQTHNGTETQILDDHLMYI